MPSNLNFIILILISGAPLLLWVTGLFGSVLPGEHIRLMARLSNGAAGLSFIGAALAALLYAVGGKALTVTPFFFVLPRDMGALALSIYINTVTLVMLALVSFVGFVVSRYTRHKPLLGDLRFPLRANRCISSSTRNL
ncbi:hypothetical protein [Acidithiobacillus thiooxidans]|uniref:Uncharacterized protein n=1 Tax=Acidithiobacillus thiooxidans ATCC 19377 TaxID=637390 RepID=A0A5P9XME0_ACITH|nr:hypothetical protein [Acidithiobacillus thiooxidans]QFX95155.1 hypothetical protein GCD22_00670 [Acidithiobacillus thiooxidans ATCC 19377]